MKRNSFEIAQAVLENGKPFLRYFVNESACSGIWSTKAVVVRWGMLELTLHNSGYVHLICWKKSAEIDTGFDVLDWPLIDHEIYNPTGRNPNPESKPGYTIREQLLEIRKMLQAVS